MIKVLIVATHGLGDAIMTLQATGVRQPGAEYFFLTTDHATNAIIQKMGAVDQKNIITINDFSGSKSIKIWKLVKKLRKQKFHVAISQYGVNMNKFIILTRLAGIKHTIGWCNKKQLKPSWGVQPGDKHKVIETRKLIEYFNYNYLGQNTSKLTKSEITTSSSSDYIVLGVMSFDDEKHKRWPLTRYATLCEEIEKRHPSKSIFIVGSPDESKYAERLLSLSQAKNIRNLCGKQTISELCDLVANAEFVIANCNAISHISGFYGVKTIGLYGPTDHKLTGPFSAALIPVVPPNIKCRPCYNYKNTSGCADPICMPTIKVNEVLSRLPQ